MAGRELTAEHAFLTGRFLGWRLAHPSDGTHRLRVLIGKDTRRSSYMFEYALAAGLNASGADAYILHVTTTACVSFITRTDGYDCGIMISASHNPYCYNGIKIVDGTGEKTDGKIISELEEFLDCPRNIPYSTGINIGRCIDCVSGRNRYIGHLIALSCCSFKGYKVGLDCADGSAWQIAKSVFDALGAKTYAIGCAPDGANINNSGAVNMDKLRALVKAEGLDVGFAFDGDADRCIAADEKGNVVDGDGILYICATHLKRAGGLGAGGVVATIASNGGLESSLNACGIPCAFSDVGDRFVYKKMCESGAALGGEQSGHIIFSKYGATGDGLVTAIKLMEILVEKGGGFSSLLKGYYPLFQARTDVRVKNKNAIKGADMRICENIGREEGCIRVLVRPSGTEPVIRVMAEGENELCCRNCCDRIARYLGDM